MVVLVVHGCSDEKFFKDLLEKTVRELPEGLSLNVASRVQLKKGAQYRDPAFQGPTFLTVWDTYALQTVLDSLDSNFGKYAVQDRRYLSSRSKTTSYFGIIPSQ